jgi:sirohydrochlorin ferrochelatase
MRHAIIIEGYGTASGYECANQMHAERLTEMLGEEVYYGCAHIGEPAIEDTIEEVASEEPDALIVVPLYFAPSDFTEGNTLRRFNADPKTRRGRFDLGGREVDVYVAKVFTTDPGMVDYIRRIAASEVKDKQRTGIILVGHGSRTGENMAIIEGFRKDLAEQGYDVVSCSNEFSEQTVEAGLETISSRKDDIVVIPMFVSPNHHAREEVTAKLGLGKGRMEGTVAKNGKSISIRMVEEIGCRREVLPILLRTIRESGFLE